MKFNRWSTGKFRSASRSSLSQLFDPTHAHILWFPDNMMISTKSPDSVPRNHWEADAVGKRRYIGETGFAFALVGAPTR